MTRYIKAEEGLQHSVIYTADDGRYFRYSDGTWTWRNHNTGNLVPGAVSKRHNQIGVAGGFAVFPDDETGHSALIDCLETTHWNKSIDQMLDDYAPKKYNPNLAKYKKFLHQQTGVMDNKKIRDFTPEEFEKLWTAIERWEGQEKGNIVEMCKISCVRTDEKNIISTYCVDNFGWIEKDACINLARQGKIDAEVCTSHSGNSYLRARARSSFQDDFDNLKEKNNEN
jgi:uncharacterized protein YjhX (UPF0386 family)